VERTEETATIKKERERGKRLYKNYRWTNEMYSALDNKQGHVCAACGQPPKEGGMPLVVDHEHFKIVFQRVYDGWTTSVSFKDGRTCHGFGKTKAAAKADVENIALPMSVRGLLCPGRHGKAGHGSCNRLIGRVDNVEWLKKVIHYLENPPAKSIFPCQK
jgi:hypothetical protein